MEDKYVSRNIGGLTKIHEFCDKYHLSKESNGRLEDITENALVTLLLQNEFRRPPEQDNYKKIKVHYNGTTIAVGYFNEDQINDIKNFNHVRVELI